MYIPGVTTVGVGGTGKGRPQGSLIYARITTCELGPSTKQSVRIGQLDNLGKQCQQSWL